MRLAPAPPPGSLATLAELVEARAGLRFEDSRRAELAAKATRAFDESGCLSWDQYVAWLTGPDGAPGVEKLLETLVVGETYFFRHRSYFDMLERNILPPLIAGLSSGRQLHVWCAGCATGEEAYSLAILLRRLLPDVDMGRGGILATDLSRDFLRRAEDGVYGDWSFRETEAGFKAANFTRDGDRYRVLPALRQLIRFRQLNLVEEGYPWSPADGTAGFDLILCRNVLIYFTPEVAERVLARLRAALVPGGYLVLGPSDPLRGPVNGFELRFGLDAFMYRRIESEAAAPSPPPPPPVSFVPSPPEQVGAPLTIAADWLGDWRTARELADGGRLDEAAARCGEAIASAPHRPEPYYLLGTLHQLRGNEPGAIAALRQALYVDRGFVPAYLALAAVHRQAGRPEEARRALERAERVLAGRAPEELILPDEGLTVGRLRDTLARALTEAPRIEAA